MLRTLLISLLLATSLSGCALFRDKPIEIVSKPLDKSPLNLSSPDPLRLRPVQWVVVTPQNAEQVFRQLEAKGLDPVLFALSDNGYMSLSENLGEVRNFMNTQRQIIIQYKKYYEDKPAAAKPEVKP